jgi:hypothetical protein
MNEVKKGNPKRRLETEVALREMWATPNTMDHLPPKSPESMKKQFEGVRKGRTKPSNLREQVHEDLYPTNLFPTPTARDFKGANSVQTMMNKRQEGKQAQLGQLPNRVALEESLKQLSNEEHSNSLENMPKPRGQLNPLWVEWLMGYPIGYTDLNS